MAMAMTSFGARVEGGMTMETRTMGPITRDEPRLETTLGRARSNAESVAGPRPRDGKREESVPLFPPKRLVSGQLAWGWCTSCGRSTERERITVRTAVERVIDQARIRSAPLGFMGEDIFVLDGAPSPRDWAQVEAIVLRHVEACARFPVDEIWTDQNCHRRAESLLMWIVGLATGLGGERPRDDPSLLKRLAEVILAVVSIWEWTGLMADPAGSRLRDAAWAVGKALVGLARLLHPTLGELARPHRRASDSSAHASGPEDVPVTTETVPA
jgi:hypothetical protein